MLLGTTAYVSDVVTLLRARADEQPHKDTCIFLADGDSVQASLSNGELDLRARTIGRRLQDLGAKGERVLLLYPPGLDYVAAFFGCLYAGAVAIPLYPPRANRTLARVQHIAADATARFALTTSQVFAKADDLINTSQLGELTWLTTDDLDQNDGGDWIPWTPAPNALAYLQYSSGSTANPKGIMISHANLLHNSAHLDAGWKHTSDSRIVSWLPHFHDMGLVYGIVQPVYKGIQSYLMPPAAFLQRPLLWLQAISRHQATHTAAPNFAYDLCINKISDEECESLDLRSWQVAVNGAEPVRRSTLDRFIKKFAPCGFRANVFCPGYGLAEATLKVSASGIGEEPVFFTTQSAALEHHRVVQAAEGSPQSQTWAGCGRATPEMKIAVVDPNTGQRCAADQVGEIWVSSPSVALGYWNRPEETAECFNAYFDGEGPYLRTGDLGFVYDGELFLTGRQKDLLIIRGRNHYPQDLELTAEQSHPDLRPGCGAAFPIQVDGEEKLVIVFEVKRHYRAENFAAVIGAIRRNVAEEHELQVYGIVLISPNTIHKTSSGKIQRRACRASFLAGELEVVGSSILEADKSETGSKLLSRNDLLAAAGDQRHQLLAAYLQTEAARLLKISIAQLSLQQPLTTFGLDSLTALELRHAIETQVGVSLPATSVISGVSIEQLAHEILSYIDSSAPASVAAYEFSHQAAGEHRLSYSQQAVWLAHLLNPKSAAYNIAAGIEINGHVDTVALRRVCQAMVDSHAALRTAYVEREGQPWQLTHEHQTVDFECVDARDLSEAELHVQLTTEADRPFDLETGHVLRIRLFTRSAAEHLLLCAIHHIACDFWSLDLLTSELRVRYQAETGETKATIASPRLTYTDFTYWQADMLAGAESDRLWSYWQKQLDGELPVLNLPTDRVLSGETSPEGDTYRFELGAELSSELSAFAKREGTTLYTTLLACFYVLLQRYSRQDDIIVGSPTSGRSRPEFSNIVGHFVNPVPLRTQLDRASDFRSLLRDVRGTVIEALAHQDYPFSVLAQKVQPERDPGHSPLFQVVFAWEQPRRFEDVETSTVKMKNLLWRQGGAPYDLMLLALEEGPSLSFTFQYRSALFEESRIRRMAEHFQNVIAAAVANPEQQLDELPLIGEEERRQLLFDWNQTEVAYDRGACLHDLFATQAARTPEAIAVVHEDQRLTYRELDQRANQLAHYLRDLGVGPGTVAGVRLPRGLQLVEAILAVLKAGGAYLPFDTALTLERVRMMARDSQAAVVIAETEIPVGVPTVALDRLQDRLARESTEPLAAGVSGDHVAYVMYTSGSTGNPKGVMIPHRAVVNLLQDFTRRQPLAVGDACSAWTTIGFDVSVYELFSALLAGGALHFVPSATRMHGAALLEWIEREQIHSAYLPPFVLVELAEKLKAGTIRLGLQRLLVGVEPIKELTLMEIAACVPGVKVINGYGPTEATVCATLFDVLRNDCQATNTPIGKPLQNTQVYLLDEHLEAVPVGVAGQLYIGGDGLALGYSGQPELTAERFLPSPFSFGARLYASGDLARHLPSGDIEFLGRLDQQVKIHGVRIELGEIETALNELPAVRESVVAARDSKGTKYLVAYVVPSGEQRPTPRELRRYLQGKLPGFMTPPAFVVLENLPQTRHGKIDRRRLPAPGEEHFARAESFVAPRTPVEELLAGMWQDALSVNQLGIHDDFFDLGGHSLLATQICSRIREAVKVDISLPGFFETPTIAGLARKIEAAARVNEAQLPPLRQFARSDRLPLSLAQRRLWFVEQMNPGTPLYNIPFGMRLRGPLSIPALEQAIAALVRRHETLRTGFNSDEEPSQFVMPPENIRLGLVDLSGIPAASQEQVSRRLFSEESERVFDLTRPPLARFSLVRLSPFEHLLLLTLHHLIADGWSLRLLVAELKDLYEVAFASRPLYLSEPEVQYADYAAWQQEESTQRALDKHSEYWRKQLSGVPPLLDLPADRPRPRQQHWQGAAAELALDPELTARLRALGRAENATLFMTLLAGFQTLISRYVGTTDVVIGTPVANRALRETESMAGLFTNMVPLRTNLSGDPSFRELMARVRSVCLSGYEHESYPFERMVQEIVDSRTLAHAPIVQVVMALQEQPLRHTQWGSLQLAPLRYEGKVAKFDLALFIGESQETPGLEGWLEYRTDLFDHWRIAAMAQHLRTLLHAAVMNPELRVSQLPLLGAEEQSEIVSGWNATQVACEFVPVHELFARQAANTPDAIAVADPDAFVTYAELDRRSTQLARYLGSLGVGPEKIVALYLPRGLQLVAAALAVVKAGGAYLPLDVNSPAERLRLMIADAGAVAVLSESGSEEGLRELSTTVIGLDTASEQVKCESAKPLRGETSQANLAYVIYTSGSTGRPKGVQVTHQGLANLVHWHHLSFAIAPEDRATLLASPAFDASVWELWPYLTAGASLHVPEPETEYSPALLQQWLVQHGITITFVPTPLAESLLPMPWSRASSLRTMLTGGDRLNQYPSPEHSFELINNYGPTEATVVATSGSISANDRSASAPNIGHPIANTQVYVVDSRFNPMPAGVPGQLVLAGHGLMRGYLGRPDLTAERLRPNPFSTDPGARVYLTGDLVRYLRAGRLEFLGRLDRQVKLRGLRIEPGEIETALGEHPNVQKVAVEIDEARSRIIAYVVCESPSTATDSDLKEYLQRRVPDYMVPARYIRLDELPLLESGKIDRARLPQVEAEPQNGRNGESRARNAAEEVLIDIWREVLGVEAVGVHDDFFALGGHSLLAARAAARVREQFNVEVGVRQLFERPTVAGLSALVQLKTHAETALPGITRLSRESYRAKARTS